MYFIFFVIAAMLLSLPSVSASADTVNPPNSYNVVWTSPSKDAAGSMPLGNGEVGINLWADNSGSLYFYISRSDSLSEIGRMLKVGGVKVTLSPNPFRTGSPFDQTLDLRDGICRISAGEGKERVSIKVFVDSDQPVIHVVCNAASPISASVQSVSWRTEARTISDPGEENSAWTMNGAPFPLIESADVFKQESASSIAWYHRNDRPLAFQSTLSVQSLTGLADTVHDPLQNRTFGAIVSVPGFVSQDSRTLVSGASVTSFSLSASCPAVQCDKPETWYGIAEDILRKSTNADAAEQRTREWWNSYWDRSWVVTGSQPALVVPGAEHPLRIGLDSQGDNKFPGELGRATVFSRPLSPDEVGQLASTPSTSPAPITDGSEWTGAGAPQVIPSTSLQFDRGFTLEAWIKPTGEGVGRIFDKLTAGQDDGFLFDIYPSHSLRFILGSRTISSRPGSLMDDAWQHVAVTYDAQSGAVALYINGKVVAGGPGVALTVGQAYTLQRYVQACEGRGVYPIKFNGGIFTVEPAEMGRSYDPDYRQWGDSQWFQNIRHMYHPMLAGGDYEMMDPFFRMYENAVPLAEGRTKLYHGAEGSYFPETMTNWGTYANSDYGWNRVGKQPGDVDSHWWRFAWNQGPELVSLMLDRWDYTKDPAFLTKQALPMAVTVLKYFDTRFKKDSSGRIILDPAQAVETYWDGVVNDMPTTAGLNQITVRLCALPADLVSPEQREFFERMKRSAPVIPLKTIDDNGVAVTELSPAQTYDPKTSNSENPELYAVWPFQLYAVGKPNIDYGRVAYAHRLFHLDIGWGYDGNCAALLGLTDEAARILLIKCANSNGAYRWPATWGPNYDWLPDQNHGGNLLETTQLMLLQNEGNKIYLLPAWPHAWDVRFRLHAAGNTVVDCVFEKGRITRLSVTPAARRKDIVLPDGLGN